MSWDTGDVINIIKSNALDEDGVGGTIFLTPEIMGVIRKLCQDIKVEWQMMLTGDMVEGQAQVTGYWIPKQEVGSASVKNLDLIDSKVIAERKIIAGIHSHGSMQVFFSSTDEKDANLSLIPINIVVNNNLDFKACVRWKLPSGAFTFLDCNVVVDGVEVEHVTGIDNITEAVYTPPIITKPWDNKDWGFKPKKKSRHALVNDYEREDYRALGIEEGFNEQYSY